MDSLFGCPNVVMPAVNHRDVLFRWQGWEIFGGPFNPGRRSLSRFVPGYPLAGLQPAGDPVTLIGASLRMAFSPDFMANPVAQISKSAVSHTGDG